VFKAPVVFLVQNNGFAISVPLARQSVAPTLAHKGVGYGIGSEQVDGNDPVAMLAVMDEAAAFVRGGNGPVIVEAHTYRIDAHTNADDATRYRDSAEVEQWLGRDPLARLDQYLRGRGLLDDASAAALTAEAETAAAELRAGMNVDRVADPMDLFRYVFAEQTPQLREQQAQAEAELAAESEEN
jgi:pyruvate dehydrogenase E1 component alpha subunit